MQTVLSKGIQGLVAPLNSQALQALQSRGGASAPHVAFAAMEESGRVESSLPLSTAEGYAELLLSLKSLNLKMPEAVAAAATQCHVAGVGPALNPEARAQHLKRAIEGLEKTVAGKKEADSKAEKYPWEDKGLTIAEQIGLKMQHDIGLKAEAVQAERDKRAQETMERNWDDIRALVAAPLGEQRYDEIIEWWEDGYNYDIRTGEGQDNMFSLIAKERDMEPKSVPDDIMRIIKGTCWAFYLHEDCRINDYTGQIFKTCVGKVLTQEQKDAGEKPCPLIHDRLFADKKTALNYMLVGAKKHEYKLLKDKEALEAKSSGRRPNPPNKPKDDPREKEGGGKAKGDRSKGRGPKGGAAGSGGRVAGFGGRGGDGGLPGLKVFPDKDKAAPAAGKAGAAPKGGAPAEEANAAADEANGKPKRRPPVGKQKHCQICQYDGTLANGLNDDATAEEINDPDWEVHGTAYCKKNPQRGFICTECYLFGHSADVCMAPRIYGKNGGSKAYAEWYDIRRRHYWVKPTGVEFEKEFAAQTGRDPPMEIPAPHPCMIK